MRSPFKVSFQENGDVVIVKIMGKMFGCPNFEDILYDPVNEFLDRGFRKFVLDMSRVRYITSIGVSFINAIYTSIKNDHGEIVLCGQNDRVLSVFHVAELDRLYTSYPNVEKAIVSFGGTVLKQAEEGAADIPRTIM
jgi:anti-anti-sigma factor